MSGVLAVTTSPPCPCWRERNRWQGPSRGRSALLAVALSVRAAWPAAGTALALLKLLLGAADPAFARCHLLRVLHPADELVSCERRDVVPCFQSGRVAR